MLGASQNGAIGRRDNLERDRIASRISRKLRFHNAVAEPRHVPLYRPHPNSTMRIGSDMTGRKLRLGKHLADLKIADTNELSGIAFACRPNVAGDVFRQSEYHS